MKRRFLAHLSPGELLPSQSVHRRWWRRLLTFPLIDFFSRTIRQISTKLGRNHAWGMGIQICSNKGAGQNKENFTKSSKIFFS